MDNTANSAASVAPSASMKTTAMVQGLKHLFESGEWSDLTVVCGDEASTTFRVHKSILCSRSTFFAGACCGGFSEAASNTISLPEDPDTVKAMLQCAYGILPAVLEHENHPRGIDIAAIEMRLNAVMLFFIAVDKYDLEKDVHEDLEKSVHTLLSRLRNPLSVVSFARSLYDETGEGCDSLDHVIGACINDRLTAVMANETASELLAGNKRHVKHVLIKAAAGTDAKTAHSVEQLQGICTARQRLQQRQRLLVQSGRVVQTDPEWIRLQRELDQAFERSSASQPAQQ